MSLVFVISAPSGSGKSTLVEQMLNEDPKLKFSTSYTTRNRTAQDREGFHYNFTSKDAFQRMVANNEFLEWAEVHGNYYGTHRSVLDDANNEGRDLLLDIDVQGARQLKETIPDAVRIFILAPSRGELETRLRRRQRDSDAVIKLRVARAAQEIEGFGDYHYVIVNDDVVTAGNQLRSIIQAERRRSQLTAVRQEVAAILETFKEPA
ncbi:MAG: guanylate kinase [Bryobacteraceae bacterium]|nr:guanylate kinase [Bryobacteraceae bacterium]